MTAGKRNARGRVDFVGAGPGDPGLITLAGAECLRRAEVVIYDALVNPRILDHCRPGAQLVSLGKHGHERVVPQAEVNELMTRLAREGRYVVRLKGGDPAVFARIAEETEALEAAGIEYLIVPGVTVALAAGSYAGIPLTMRDCASAVALVTGQQGDAAPVGGLDYRALAAFPGTLVFYMGVTTAPDWVAALVAGGKSAQTPVAVVRYCSWPRQQVWRTTLGELPRLVAQKHIRPPVVAIVGEVVAAGDGASWFTRRPLFGTRVLVTRARDQAMILAAQLEELGADVVVQPAIEIGPPEDWAPVDRALGRLDQFDWLVFSSANGVRAFFERLLECGGDLRWLAGLKLAAIGPGTAAELAGYHLRADLQPDEFRAEALAAELVAAAPAGRFLLARASRGREVLAEQLAAAGAHVEQIVVYRSTDVREPDAQVAAQLAAGAIDWVTVTSSAIARSLAAMFGQTLARAKLASISPVTTATLRELGYEPVVEARAYTMDGLCEAIRESTVEVRQSGAGER